MGDEHADNAAVREPPMREFEGAVPAAVDKTVAGEAAHATVKGFSREVENGQTFYEVELNVD